MATFTTPVKTWASGDILTAADLNTYLRDNEQYLYDARITKIASNILGGTTASVTFSSIPGTYSSLMVIHNARGDTAAGNTTLLLRFNADSGTNYDYSRSSITGTGTTSNIEGQAASAAVMGIISASSAPANVVGCGMIVVPNYAGTTFQKAAEGQANSKTSTSAGGVNQESYAGFWRSTAAITSITLLPNAGSFITGSSFWLYGCM